MGTPGVTLIKLDIAQNYSRLKIIPNQKSWLIDIYGSWGVERQYVNLGGLLKKLSLISVVTLVWTASLFAQAPDTLWTRTYGGTGWDQSSSVQETSDGGFIIDFYYI